MIIYSNYSGEAREHLLAQIVSLAAKGEKSLWLVPEPYSHQSERFLAKHGGAPICKFAEVVTFKKLIEHIISETGGLNNTLIDEGGRILLMRKALKETAFALKTLSAFAAKSGFLPSLLDTLDECKSYGIRPLDLAFPGLDKLDDLSLIFSTYDMLSESLDPLDKISHAIERISGFNCDCHFFVSDFISFTLKERQLLKRLSSKAESFGVYFRAAPANKHFGGIAKTARELSGDSAGEEILSGFEPLKHPALRHLEENWFADKPKVFGHPSNAIEPKQGQHDRIHFGHLPDAIELYSAPSLGEEVRFAAERILELVRYEGYRFRDILVMYSDDEAYSALIEAIFAQYNIPIFSDKMDELADKPICQALKALADCAKFNYREEDASKLLRSGLFGFSLDDIDLFENYLRRWRPRGKRFSAADWTRPLEGWDETPDEMALAELCRINAIRRKIAKSVEILKSGKTGAELGDSLIAALKHLGIDEGLELRVAKLTDFGFLKRANETSQMFEVLESGVLQTANILGQEELDYYEFTELCLLALSGYSIGSIPVSLDRVHVGDQGRVPRIPADILLYIGLSPDKVPARTAESGLLTRAERIALSDAGCELPPDPVERVEREFYNLYTAVSLPAEKLIIICQTEKKDEDYADGVQKIRGMFGLSVKSIPPMILPYAEKPISKIPLSGEMTTELYGKTLSLGASKISAFCSCPFKYFCKYGIKAKSLLEYGVRSLDVGFILHKILEECAKFANERGGFMNISALEIEDFAEARAEFRLKAYTSNATARISFQAERIIRTSRLLAGKLRDEFKRSKFTPLGFEFSVGGNVMPLHDMPKDAPNSYKLSGFADRVDGFRKDGTLYLRVADYKTGDAKFSLEDVRLGIGMQLPLYLFLLLREAPERFGAEKCVGAGMFYVKTNDLIRETDAKHSGILLGEPDILLAMDEKLREPEWNSLLPVKFNKKDGNLSAKSSVYSLGELEEIRQDVGGTIKSTAREIASGVMEEEPISSKSGKSICEYCEYGKACYL